MDEKTNTLSFSIGKPKRIMEIELKEVRPVERDSLQDEEMEKHLCDDCKMIASAKAALAERYCIKCEEKLCLLCCQQHTNKEEHLVVALTEEKETKRFKESNFCNVHNEELADLYCACCRKVICGECEKENHISHNCSKVGDVADLVSKQAETEYEKLLEIQCHFDKEREKLSNEEIKLLKAVKEMETDIRKRCDEITAFVYNETNALLKELDLFRRERLEEIKMERRKMEGHAFAFEKFKEYCDRVKSNAVPRYTCEAEGFLRNIPDDLKSRPEGRWKSKLFSVQLSIQKIDFKEIVTSLSDAVGKLTIKCPYKTTKSSKIDIGVAEVFGMARLDDKLYLLSNSISIRRLHHPFASVGEIKIPEIKYPKEIVSCSKTSCLYIYDNGVDCVWKVSIPDHRVSLWLDEVKQPNALSVTPNAELLMLRNSKTLVCLDEYSETMINKTPVCLEVYTERAIFVRCLKLPESIRSLSSIFETPSGKYYGLGEQGVFALRRDGSIISQFETSKHKECWGNPRCFDMLPYSNFLHYGPISSLTFDLTSHQSLKTKTEGLMAPINSCYLEKSKQLLVLESTNTGSRILRIYHVFPA